MLTSPRRTCFITQIPEISPYVPCSVKIARLKQSEIPDGVVNKSELLEDVEKRIS